ncbi:MAG: manganese efflux pump MntP family protein [Clostridia bacterium]|nr:manganese efflux pump MntP family protein [Clostridia bacterium]
MQTTLAFILKNILLGVGLAMDAFSVSLANGLNEPCMRKRKMCLIAGTFAFFQAFMPMAGWVCVHTIVQYFTAFSKFIPYIAFVLLAYIGGKMLLDAFHGDDDKIKPGVGFAALFVQGIATSIDALSVGFTIAEYNWLSALVASLIIAAVTFVVCTIGLVIGKKFGTSLSGKAQILGGVILILIGIEILVKGIM